MPLKHPAQAVRVARLLVLVLAGREYVYAASVAARSTGQYLRAGDSMGPAVSRGVWLATAAASTVLAIGLGSILIASRRHRTGVSR